MKKVLMSLVLMTGMLFATGFEIPCLTCEDGIDGKGWTEGYYNPETGQVVFNSDDGLGFTTGDLRGSDGADGTNGINGTNGKDGQDFNSELYTAELIKMKIS